MNTLTFTRTIMLDFDDAETEIQQTCRAIYQQDGDGNVTSIKFEIDDARPGFPSLWFPISMSIEERNAVEARIEAMYREDDQRQADLMADMAEAS